MKNLIVIKKIFFVSLAAIPAVLLRWQIDQIVIINLIGCFLIGFINTLSIPKNYKLALSFGFCGSLTSFSGWSYQLFDYLHRGLFKLFFFNSVLIVILCILAVYLGRLVAKKVIN